MLPLTEELKQQLAVDLMTTSCVRVLDGRSFCARVNASISMYGCSAYGLPRGSCLAPFLYVYFHKYINLLYDS